MANVRLSASTRNAMLNALRDKIDAGSGAGTLKIYTGPQPANSDVAISSQTLLATLTFSDPSAPDAASGLLTFTTITEDTAADATGLAAWARIADSDGNTVTDVDVATAGATINLNTVDLVVGGPVRINSGAFMIPGG